MQSKCPEKKKSKCSGTSTPKCPEKAKPICRCKEKPKCPKKGFCDDDDTPVCPEDVKSKCPPRDCNENVGDKCNDTCAEFKNPKNLLSKRVRRVKCFAKMMSNEKKFIKFCKRIHITIGTCLYSWILILCCLIERIDWTTILQSLMCSIRQMSILENSIDNLRLVECKLICCIATPYPPGALWHYFTLLILLPILSLIQIISFKLAILLKIKNLIFGVRIPCPDEEVRKITTAQCTCTTEDYEPTASEQRASQARASASKNNEAGGDTPRASAEKPASGSEAAESGGAAETTEG